MNKDDEILTRKSLDLARVTREIEALRIVAVLLQEEEDRPRRESEDILRH
jgi:hypothetical protein